LIHICRDGTQMITASRWALQRDATGQPRAVLEIGSDITEQKRTYARLTYQAQLLANVSDAVIGTDASLRISAWNRAAQAIFGWTAEEAMGKLAPDLLRARILAATRGEAYLTIAQKGSWSGEVLRHTKDGSPIVCEVTTMGLRDERGQITGYVEVCRDVTERKQVEEARNIAVEALARSESELRRRGERLQVLHEIDQAILAAHDPVEIAQVAVDYILRVIPGERAAVVLFDSEAGRVRLLAASHSNPAAMLTYGPLPLAAWRVAPRLVQGQPDGVEDLMLLSDPIPIEQMMLDEGARSYRSLPLVAGDVTIGALTLWLNAPGRPAPEQEHVARQIADSVAVAMHNARLLEQGRASRRQLQALSRRLVEVLENERHVIAQELHDEAGQALTGLKLGLQLLNRDAGNPQVLATHIAELQQTVTSVMEELHRLAVNLRPISLDRYGLVPALEQYVDSYRRGTGLELNFVTAGFEEDRRGANGRPGTAGRLPPEVETAVYRAVQEALTNIARHSQATRAGITLEHTAGRLSLVVNDNGVGFGVEEVARKDRLGLLGIRERAEMLDGSLTIESAPGQGTTLYLTLPLPAAVPSVAAD
jgi:PAS domain S-box-containing protein